MPSLSELFRKEARVVTDKQVRRLMELLSKGKNLCTSAAKADMDEKTARKYRGLNKLPNEIKVDHTWRTRYLLFTSK